MRHPPRFPAFGLTTSLLAFAAGCNGGGDAETGGGDTGTADVPWACGDEVVDARDGATYRTIAIGEQCWLRDNLNPGAMIETTQPGQEAHDDGQVEKYCWDNDTAECDGTGDMKRGGFYEWQEALQDYSGQPALPVQGICPSGFHLPSRAEWDVLVDGLGGISAAPAQLAVGGGSGFDALMTGYRCTMTGGFRPSAMSAQYMTYFWTSEASGSADAWLWEIGEASMQTFAFRRSLGLSVRCLLDDQP